MNYLDRVKSQTNRKMTLIKKNKESIEIDEAFSDSEPEPLDHQQDAIEASFD